MLTKSQLSILSKKLKINESVILREYIQILLLNKIYSFPKSTSIYFKGGTCLHLLYQAPRFSEDLDFTVQESEPDFIEFIKVPFKELVKENDFIIKEKKSLAGKTYLLTYKNDLVAGEVYVKLDFSFREKVLEPKKNILETEFPILINNYINCLSPAEILAEKVRAILSRDKGRDYYDMWFLLSKNVEFNTEYIKEKLLFYNLKISDNYQELREKIISLNKTKFIIDLRPFIPVDQRDKLGIYYEFIRDFILNKLASTDNS